jgi:hypothetical protein
MDEYKDITIGVIAAAIVIAGTVVLGGWMH